MKKINILLIALLTFCLIASVAADDVISVEDNVTDFTDGDSIAETSDSACIVQMIDEFDQEQVYQLEGKIQITNIDKNVHYIYAYIDGINDLTFVSGGVADWEGDHAQYVLPYNLGEGKHTLSLVCVDDNDKILSKNTYAFTIKGLNMPVDDESSFYYEEDVDSVNDEPSVDKKDTVLKNNDVVSESVNEETINNEVTVQDPVLPAVNISLGEQFKVDDSHFDLFEFLLKLIFG